MKVVDVMRIADDLYRDKGKDAVCRLVSVMKKLEQIKISGNKLVSKPAAFKLIHPKKHNVWEYKSGELRFYFYLDFHLETLFLLGYSTKDRQKDVLKFITKKVDKVKEIIAHLRGRLLSDI